MNESMSILLATTILALGGLGLYMYKSDNNDSEDKDNKYSEEGLFGSSKLTGWWSTGDDSEDENNKSKTTKKSRSNKHKHDDYSDLDEEYLDLDDDEYEKPRRKSSKTLKNRKTNGSSKRRY